MNFVTEIKKPLDTFHPIGLNEMDNVRLMDRVDTKYVMSVLKLNDLLTRLDGGYLVLEIDGNRFFSYRTTYLDTSDYLFFNQHVTGKFERSKVRFRKYENTGVTYLEVKKRTNKNRTVKWRIENDLDSENKCDKKASDFIEEYIPERSLVLKPVLINRFNRVTLVGAENNERITIDYNLSFSDTNGNQISFPFITIIELKRQGLSNSSPLANILKDYSIRPTSFSKYCIGTGIFYDVPRKNILKQKMLLINKIENEYNKSLIH
jgi:hypothetical protein